MEISNDFSKLIIKVKPSWQGTQGEGKLRWKMTDSLGQVRDAFRTVDFGKREAQGYFTFQNCDFIKSGFRDYTYVGSKTKGKENLTMTIASDYWREPLSAIHIIKFANPTPYLTKLKLLLNTGAIGTAYTEIGLKDAYETTLSCDDSIIEGKCEITGVIGRGYSGNGTAECGE